MFCKVENPTVEMYSRSVLVNTLYFVSTEAIRGVVYEEMDETIDSAKFVLVFSKFARRVAVTPSVLRINDCVEIVDSSFVLIKLYSVLNEERSVV